MISGLLVPGCGEGWRDLSYDLCDGQLRPLAGVEPEIPVDSMELRSILVRGSSSEAEWVRRRVVDTTGEPCGTAADEEACLAELDNTWGESELVWPGNTHQRLVYTRGDEVGVVSTRDGLREFLGAIDAPGDAALAVRFFADRPPDSSLDCVEGPEVGEHRNGFLVKTSEYVSCPGNTTHYLLLVRPDGTTEVLRSEEVASDRVCVGRLPGGLCVAPRLSRDAPPVGRFFADLARLEASAVPAFAELEQELRLHGAPRSLVARARQARRDEMRHARQMAGLARRYGARAAPPTVRATPPRSLIEVAKDNAHEGCVRETYGALVAFAQAHLAEDPEVRRTLRQIAFDELSHAALSWSLRDWVLSRLGPSDRRRLRRAEREAWDRLEVGLTRAAPPEVQRVAGMPDAARSRRWYRAMRDRIC